MSRMGRWSAREIARRAYRRVESQGAYANLAIDAELSSAPKLERRERALATELVYGTLRHRGRLDRALTARAPRGIHKLAPLMRIILRIAAYQILMLDRIPDHAAVDDAVRAARKLGGNRMAGFANGVLRALAREGEPALPKPEDGLLEHVEHVYSLPHWIALRLQAAVGDDQLIAVAAAFSTPAPLAIRVNTLQVEPARLAVILANERSGVEVEEVPGCPEALQVSGLGDPSGSPSFDDGLWTVQDVGAQLVSRLANPVAGQRVLDACAGLGGKSTHLAQLAGDGATVLAVDISASKLEQARAAARRLGLRSMQTRVVDLLLEPIEETFDCVVLDAPCSGLGVLRRHPEAKWRLDEKLIGQMAQLQSRLLDAAVPCVSPGGALCYSVCTFTDEEGPAQVAAFLARHADFAQEGEPLRTWPHRDDADAFFGALLRRNPAS